MVKILLTPIRVKKGATGGHYLTKNYSTNVKVILDNKSN